MHQDLTQIAAERSPEKRLELLRRVTDLYFEGIGTHEPSEAYLFNEIMDRIVDQFSRDMKREVAASLAIQPDFPTNIVRKLASEDDIEIARPVLSNAFSLSNDDLVELAMRGSQAHLTAIAARASLPEEVTDVLVDRGETGVVHAVTANHGARFSERGMDRLLGRCADDVDLRELLVERPDLSPRVVEKLVPILSESLVKKLAERGHEVNGALPPDMVHALRQRFTAAMQTRKENILHISVVIDQIRNGRVKLDDAVRQIVESGRLLDAAAILSTFARLDRDYMFKLLLNGEMQTVLVLCRSLELTWPPVDSLLAARATKHRTRYHSDPKVRAGYEAIDLAVAQRTMRFLRVRQVAGNADQREQVGAA